MVVVLALGLAVALPWGIHETRVANRNTLVRATAAPATYTVMAGTPDPAGPTHEYPAYYPNQVSAHPGDTIDFVNPTPDVPHTVTFGVAQDRSNQPVFGSHGGGPISIVVAPCASDAPLSPSTLDCVPPPASGSTAASLPPFSGQALYNSGIIGGGQRFSLHLSSAIKPGTYRFYCLVHPSQQGAIVVKRAGQPTQVQGTVDAAARDQQRRDARTLSLLQPPVSLAPLHVQAGVVGPQASLNQFFPATLHVRAGQTVTWDNRSATPHVMIFDQGVTADVALFSPPTAPSGSDYAGGAFITGPIGVPAYPATTFSLTFTTPGTYSYFCAFHPGMAGTITVDSS